MTQPLGSSKINKPTLVKNHPRSQIPPPKGTQPQIQTPSPSHHCGTTRDLEGCGPREQSLPWSSSSFSPWFPMRGRYRGSVPDMVRGSAHTVGTSPLWRRCLPVLCLLHFLLCWTLHLIDIISFFERRNFEMENGNRWFWTLYSNV